MLSLIGAACRRAMVAESITTRTKSLRMAILPPCRPKGPHLREQMMRIVAPVALFLISLPLAASAFKEGPYPNVTGGFGEQSCHLCHLDNPINAPGGWLTLEGIPPAYTSGQKYNITVTIAREGLRRGGFEISARFA